MSSMPAWSIKQIPGQPGLYRETLSQKTKQNKQRKNPEDIMYQKEKMTTSDTAINNVNPTLTSRKPSLATLKHNHLLQAQNSVSEQQNLGCTPVIPEPGSLRQEPKEPKAILNYARKSWLKTKAKRG